MYDLDKLEGLDNQQRSALLKAGYVDASEVLLASPFELNKALRSSNNADINRLLHDISASICVESKVVSSLITFDTVDSGNAGGDRVEEGWIGTGDQEIDSLLGGGIRRGLLTEVAGESASGKSHFGLQLALTAQLPSCSAEPGGAILLTSERKISFTRLEQIARIRLTEEVSTNGASAGTRLETRIYLDNVHTMHVTEVDGLEHALAYMVPHVIDMAAESASTNSTLHKPSKLPISLIIIDSIGALFRSSYDSNQGGLPQRSRMLCVIADRLKYLAHKYNIAVVVINQVSDVFRNVSYLDGPSRTSRPNSPALMMDTGRGSSVPDNVQPTMTYKVQSQYFSGQTKSLSKEASLGLVWANAVNVRIMLSRTGRRRPLDPQDLSRRIKRPRTIDGRYRQGLDEEERLAVNAARNIAPNLRTEEASPEQSWEATLIRRIHHVFSPFAKQDCLDYVITQSGIHSLAPADYSITTDNDTRTPTTAPAAQHQSRTLEDNEFQDEVFDDLGNLPVDFWTSEAFEQMQAETRRED